MKKIYHSFTETVETVMLVFIGATFALALAMALTMFAMCLFAIFY